ncbi:MAG TPA: COX15/CtaA family protein [Kofleriaceae bacterium]|nr:COX15/CtaA family protein [Kofleriaceae bacterium]
MLEHRIAKLAAVFVFLMLVIGGTVNATGSSLACEWWFTCKGSLFPHMSGGVLFEHGHRMWGWVVGLLQITLTVLLVRRRPDLRRLPWLTLAMVLVQGSLGMMTVKYKLPWFISTAHLLLGMSYFATLLYAAYVTRPPVGPLPEEANRRRARLAELGTSRRWIFVAFGVLVVQIFLGAMVRHFAAWGQCLGMPACTVSGDYFPHGFLPRIHMIHRGFGVLTAIVTIVAGVQVARHARSWPRLRLLALAAPVIACAQVTLGILTVLTWRAVPIAVGHFAGATALWGLWIGMWIMTGSGRRSMAGGDTAAVVP